MVLSLKSHTAFERAQQSRRTRNWLAASFDFSPHKTRVAQDALLFTLYVSRITFSLLPTALYRLAPRPTDRISAITEAAKSNTPATSSSINGLIACHS
jgi:hypothetical protein